MELNEDIYYGLWWIPNSNQKVQGKLTITPTSIELRLVDPNIGKLVQTNHDDTPVPLIYGKDQNLGVFTLLQCTTWDGENFSCELAIDGKHHYECIEALKFKALEVIMPSFNYWFRHDSMSTQNTLEGFTLTYRRPENIVINISTELQLEFEFKCHPPSGLRFRSGKPIRLYELATIHLLSVGDAQVSLLEIKNVIAALQAFISFFVREGCNIEFIRGYNSVADLRQQAILEGAVIYGLYNFNEHNVKHDSFGRTLLDYESIIKCFPLLIVNWLGFYNKTPHLISLMQYDYFYRGKFDESRFLNLARALEIFHLDNYNNHLLPSKLYKAKFKEIIEGVPEKYRDEVKQNLTFLNNPKLNQRLTELMSDIQEIGIESNGLFLTNKMADKARYCRNYYTHYNSNDKKKALFGKELEDLTRDCRTLLNILILKKIRVPTDILADNFKYYVDNTYYPNF